jgi:hypothetical protein
MTFKYKEYANPHCAQVTFASLPRKPAATAEVRKLAVTTELRTLAAPLLPLFKRLITAVAVVSPAAASYSKPIALLHAKLALLAAAAAALHTLSV